MIFMTNSPPTAVASVVNQNVVVVGALVTLNGTSSSDPDGDPLSYRWRLPYGSGGAADVSSYTSSTLTFTARKTDVIVFSLTVNDGKEDSAAIAVTVTVVEASTLIPTYSLKALSASVDEGSAATFVITTKNVALGTLVPYTLMGVSSTDISGEAISGNAVVNANGIAIISVSILNDFLTEGPEILIVTSLGNNASVKINDTSTASIKYETHSLSVIVDKGVLSTDPTLLKGLIEKITITDGEISMHTVEYAGLTFDYNQIDALITTVSRDGEFTSEFTKEINEYLGTELDITYSAAVKLIGAANIDGVILSVAGADGNFVE